MVLEKSRKCVRCLRPATGDKTIQPYLERECQPRDVLLCSSCRTAVREAGDARVWQYEEIQEQLARAKAAQLGSSRSGGA